MGIAAPTKDWWANILDNTLAAVGIAPYQYLMQQRVERAKQLLKQQAISISNIALDCGFSNQTHLTKVFRQMTGMTPKAYQKRWSRVILGSQIYALQDVSLTIYYAETFYWSLD